MAEKYTTVPEEVEAMVFTNEGENALEITKWIDSKGWSSRWLPELEQIQFWTDEESFTIIPGLVLVFFPSQNDFGGFEQDAFNEFFKKVED